MADANVRTGVVKRWGNLGYGFISDDETGDKNIFVHWKDIEMDGFRKLREGQRVTFETKPGQKEGQLKAINVRVVEVVQSAGEEPTTPTTPADGADAAASGHDVIINPDEDDDDVMVGPPKPGDDDEAATK